MTDGGERKCGICRENEQIQNQMEVSSDDDFNEEESKATFDGEKSWRKILPELVDESNVEWKDIVEQWNAQSVRRAIMKINKSDAPNF